MMQRSADAEGLQVPEDCVDDASVLRHSHTPNGCVVGGVSDKERLLAASIRSYGSIESGDTHATPAQYGVIKTYKTRFWILVVFSLLCWVHDIQWVMWGPISETMNAAFSGWGPSTVALMVNWGTIMYVFSVVPMCWATQRYGLRNLTVACATLLTVGASLRCVTIAVPAFTILCHVCAIVVGVTSTFFLSAPPLIAADWFPARERTTAMAIMMGAHQLGAVGNYLEPLVVRMPAPGVTVAEMQQDVMRLTYISAGMVAVLVVVVVAYFPSKPPSAPSLSSATERVRFLPGLKTLLKNKKLMVLLLSYGMFVGPPVMWITVMNYSLLPLGFHQDKAMWVGVGSVLLSSVSPVISGRINDLLRGHIKTVLIAIMLITTGFFYWFLLLSYGTLPVTDWQVYVSVIGGISVSYSSIPLFLEIAIDLAFPVPEIVVSGIVIGADCMVAVVFLLLFNVPNIGYMWITWTLTFCSSLTILPLLAIKCDNTRTNIDATTH